MITGPNNPNVTAASNAVSKYTAESKAGKASSTPRSTDAAISVENAMSSPAPASDVTLSKEAQMMQKLAQEISSYPSVDAERVAEIKREIVSNGISINSGSIAKKMMLLDSLY